MTQGTTQGEDPYTVEMMVEDALDNWMNHNAPLVKIVEYDVWKSSLVKELLWRIEYRMSRELTKARLDELQKLHDIYKGNPDPTIHPLQQAITALTTQLKKGE